MAYKYSDPVTKLLTYEDDSPFEWYTESVKWPDYLQLGLTTEHIHELIQLMQDENFSYHKNVGSWASIHARRALGQLRAKEAIECRC